MLIEPPRWMFNCDPGLMSGVGILGWTPEKGIEKIESFEGSLAEVGQALEDFVHQHSPAESEIVCERFVITPKTGELTSPDWSLKVCGVLEWLAFRHWNAPNEDSVVYQSAGDAKRLVPNEVLKRAGIWHRGGAGHARDALRHGVYRYATGYKIIDAWDELG